MAIHYMDDMKALGYPILLGTSRKSVVGLTLDLPASERVEGTMVTTVFGVMEGASFVRGSRREREFPGRSDDRGHSP